MKILMALLPSFYLPLSNADQLNCVNGEDYFQCVQYIRNYDADTITFKINGIHPLLGNKIPIRVRGVDTPELRTKNQCEKKLGHDAKLLVQVKVQEAKRIDLVSCSRGKYFRLVCDVIVDGESLAKTLIQSQFAYRYEGGTKRKMDWCKFRSIPRLPATK